jgi:hypothetical protein
MFACDELFMIATLDEVGLFVRDMDGVGESNEFKAFDSTILDALSATLATAVSTTDAIDADCRLNSLNVELRRVSCCCFFLDENWLKLLCSFHICCCLDFELEF